MGDVPPNQTVYVNNLNEKLKKEGKKEERRRAIVWKKEGVHASARTRTSAV